MKKVILIVVIVLMITSCAEAFPKENFVTEELYENNRINFDEKANNGFSLTQEQLDFWNSEYGKEILAWKTSPGYDVYVRNLKNGCILYYCEGAVYIKKKDGTYDEVIDQISINPVLIRFINNRLYVPFQSGTWGYGIGNFPYDYVYDIQSETSYKEMWALNIASGHHCVIGSNPKDGNIGSVEVYENGADIYFDIDLEKQTAGLDNYFPKIDFFYNEYNHTAYFYINGITHETKKINALEKIEGIDQLNVDVFENEDGLSGILFSFIVRNGYSLYAEVFTSFETTPDDHLSVWVIKK